MCNLILFNLNYFIMDFLNEITKGNANVEAIRSQLFDVISVPLLTPESDTIKSIIQTDNAKRKQEGRDLIVTNPNGGKPFEAPTVFGIYNANGGQPFGVLGKDYTPQQPTALFDSFVECLTTNTDADLTKLNYHAMRDGAKIRFSIPVKDVSFTNKRGKVDESVISLNIQTGYDGYTATSLYLSIYRLICSNGMKANVTEFKSKFKNTYGNVGKIQILCDDVTKALDASDSLTNILVNLNQIEITTKRKNEFIKNVLGYNLKDKSELTTRKLNILEAIEESIATEFSRTGATLWGLVNGFTHYTNHKVKNFDSKLMTREQYNANVDQYLFTEQGERTNKKVMEVAMAMAKQL